jgi:hypothetical protein
MFTIPSGVWAQAGYSSVYGISAGMGLNITPKISLEYNFEKGTGNLSNFGSSHEIVLAYKFKNKNYYNGDEEEEGSLIGPAERRKYVPAKSKESSTLSPIDAQRLRELKQVLIAEKEQKKVKRAKEIAEARASAKADSLTQVKLAFDAAVKANTPVQTKQVAQIKAKLEIPIQAKPTVIAQAKAKAKLAADANPKADAPVQAKMAADGKANALAQTKLATLPNDENARLMDNIAVLIKGVKNIQQELLKKLAVTVASKEKDFKNLKEENDLSEKGIFRAPKSFKSITAENTALKSLKLEIAELNNSQKQKTIELESLYSERIKKVSKNKEEFNQFYLKTIEQLKAEQLKIIQLNQTLISSLEKINIETEIEKKRKIKRAAFESDQGRYLKDRATLSQIKEKTPYSAVQLKSKDFDFGEEQSSIQILKNIKNVKSGYYLIVAVHQNIIKRDEFLTKTVAADQSNIDFFYDVNTRKYFIYYEKFDLIDQAYKALKSRGNKPYNGKMSIVKIENN